MSGSASRFFISFFLFLFGVTFMSACSFDDLEKDSSEFIKEGDKMPAFSVMLNDSSLLSNETLQGSPAMVVFFNTSCIDCRKELPIVQILYSKYADKVTFVAISREENAESVSSYWEREKLGIPYSAQMDRGVFSLFARRGIPRIYVTDAEGVVRKVFVEKASLKKLESLLDSLLNQ